MLKSVFGQTDKVLGGLFRIAVCVEKIQYTVNIKK